MLDDHNLLEWLLNNDCRCNQGLNTHTHTLISGNFDSISFRVYSIFKKFFI